MTSVKNCLLCCGETLIGTSAVKKDFFGASGELAQQIAIIFVVRKILNIPKSACQKLLEDLGNPSSWRIGYCARCTNNIQEAQFISEQLEDLNQKLNSLSLKIKSQLYQNYKKQEKLKIGRPAGSWGAVDEIRFQFSKEFSRSSKLRSSQAISPETEKNVFGSLSDRSLRLSRRHKDLSIIENHSIPNGDEYGKWHEEDLGEDSEESEENKSKSKGFPSKNTEEYLENREYSNSPSPDWLPSDGDSFSDTEYNLSNSWSLSKARRNSSGNDDAIVDIDVMEKICTDAVVKVEQIDPESETETRETLAYMENTKELEAEHEKQKNLLNESTKKGVFRCSICGFKLSSALARDAHVKRVHMGVRNPFECNLCKKTFPRKCELEEHGKVHLPGSNVSFCPKCYRKFPSKITRNAHIQSFHYGIKCPYKCTKCGRKFQRPSTLELHLKSKHRILLAEPIADPKRKEMYRMKIESGWTKTKKNNDLGLTRKFACTEKDCNRRFECELSRDGHVKRFHNGIKKPYDCTSCAKTFKRIAELNDHTCPVPAEKTLEPTSFPCDQCGKLFKTKTCLKVHKKSTAHLIGPKPFMCELCSKTFQAQRYLEDHQKLRHHEELNLTPYICPQCGKKVGSEKSLNLHIKSIHKKEFKFTCDVCHMGFEYEKSKESHMRTHTGEKPFKCSICSRGFAQKFQLYSHSRIHTGEKPFKCQDCGKLFSDKPTFNRHVEMHKGILHECSLCFKKYPTRHAFRVHMKKHEERGDRGASKSSMMTRRKTRSTQSIYRKEINFQKSSNAIANESPVDSHPILEPPAPLEAVQVAKPTNNEFRDMPQLIAVSMLNEGDYSV